MDATSLHPAGEPPVLVINTDAPTDRRRFTLAHEIGHLVCAPDPGENAEEMAQAFAAELLAPAHQVRSDLKAVPLNPARLLQLKAVWRVSAAALLRRAVDLGVLTESRYRTLNAQMSALGWRTREPEPLPAERATVVPEFVRAAIAKAGGVGGAADAAGTTVANFTALFAVEDVGGGTADTSRILRHRHETRRRTPADE